MSEPSLETRLSDVLSRFVSRINARVIAERGRRVLVDPTRVADDERARLVAALCASASLFVTGARQMGELETALTDALGAQTLPPREIAIENEDDLGLARTAAREMALKLQASSLKAQRIATAVSELARNIVSYTPGGVILLEPSVGRLRVVAADRGQGIPNLEEILGGRYRSKTGLGRGLLGVKQLMDRFEIESGPQGTRITVEAAL